MRIVPCDQGTAQWLEVRRGKITASRISDVMDFLKKGGPGSKRTKYLSEIIAERLTGRSEEHYVSPEMDWGSEYESHARTAYEIANDVMVDQVGFILHPGFDFAGSSPDGLVDQDGGLEIKAPKTTTHLRWLQAGVVPVEHQPQCLWNMACAERDWWDFMSYDPRMPEGLRIFIARMVRDERRIGEIEDAVAIFHEEAQEAIAKFSPRIIHHPAPPVDTRTDYEQFMAILDAQELVP